VVDWTSPFDVHSLAIAAAAAKTGRHRVGTVDRPEALLLLFRTSLFRILVTERIRRKRWNSKDRLLGAFVATHVTFGGVSVGWFRRCLSVDHLRAKRRRAANKGLQQSRSKKLECVNRLCMGDNGNNKYPSTLSTIIDLQYDDTLPHPGHL
jgi:hypothetical protein